MFLDYLRERRLLPEVPDYPHFRGEEQKVFSTLTAPAEDLLHLPDGRSLRRIRAPHLKGGLIFAFEDITDRLTAKREYNSLASVQREILNNIEEAVYLGDRIVLFTASPLSVRHVYDLKDLPRPRNYTDEKFLQIRSEINQHMDLVLK